MSHVSCVVVSLILLTTPLMAQEPVTFGDVLALEATTPDVKIPYGPDPDQFGELWLPKGEGAFPVLLFLHGGCWRDRYDIGHAAPVCEALRHLGVAVWSLEYRRLGHEQGSFPATFADVAKGADFLRTVAQDHPLDLERVIALGHSAGGHLALWLASRPRLDEESELAFGTPLELHGVISLAGIGSLHQGIELSVCGDALPRLLGGSPEEFEVRYNDASPFRALPLGVQQFHLHGGRDTIVPVAMAKDFHQAALEAGDPSALIVVEGAGHFEWILPTSQAWIRVEECVRKLLGMTGENRSPIQDEDG